MSLCDPEVLWNLGTVVSPTPLQWMNWLFLSSVHVQGSEASQLESVETASNPTPS